MEERRGRQLTESEAKEMGLIPQVSTEVVVEEPEMAEVDKDVLETAIPADMPLDSTPDLAQKGTGEEDPTKFYQDRGESFNIQELVLHGEVTDVVQVFPQLKVTLKSLPIESIIEIERDMFDPNIPYKTYADLISIRKLAHSITHFNGTKVLPDVNSDQEVTKESWEKAEAWLKARPRSVINELLRIHHSFEHDVDVLVNRESLKNS